MFAQPHGVTRKKSMRPPEVVAQVVDWWQGRGLVLAAYLFHPAPEFKRMNE